MSQSIYADTSILVAYYVPEPLSVQVDQALAGLGKVAVSPLVEVELYSTLSRKVREKSMKGSEADKVVSMFQSHLAARYYIRYAVAPRHFKVAGRWLADRLNGLRTLDALHLAVVYEEQLEMWTADTTLHKVASALGVPTRLFETP